MELFTVPFHYLKKLLKLLSSRPATIILLILLQIFMVFIGVRVIEWAFPTIYKEFIPYIDLLFKLVGIFAVIYIVSKDENPYFKISWISLFFFLPVVGLIIYLIMSNRGTPPRIKEYIKLSRKNMEHSIFSESIKLPQSENNVLQSNYVLHTSGYPSFANTAVEYYSIGDTMFPAFLEDLKSAKNYIFMEFFIVSRGQVLNAVIDVLEDRVKNGVKVYFMYDDIGSLTSVPTNFLETLKSKGINAAVFNPLRPRINPVLNYRDHRKIIVVDGKVAYCGGMNLADEYINQRERFGHWKDTGVRLCGDGAWTFVLMFIQQWTFISKQALNALEFKPDAFEQEKASGYVQPYADDPLASFNIAENVYLQAIWQANKYIYITTPYLVIDNAMEGALCAAAISGVDVRIITPKIYDKWYVHILTRSHYKKLIKNGVKIYEYTPGFIHSKMFVSDDSIAMVGTSNMDFRSFYHHFECSVLLYENDKIIKIKEDILDCTDISTKISYAEMDNQPIHIRLMQSILKMFAPLL